MTEPEPQPPATPTLLDRVEEWIYRLNEQDHWIFKVYDLGNELWARMVFGAVRSRAETIDEEIGTEAESVRVRFLGRADADAFASFCAGLRTRYLPPHPLDETAARAALARRSYIPLGIFVDGNLEGYLLVRLFFLRRAVAGIWIFPSLHGKKHGRNAFWVSTAFLRARNLPAYCTIPLGNTPSIHTARASGYRIIRTNRRFHVLKVDPDLFERRRAEHEPIADGADQSR